MAECPVCNSHLWTKNSFPNIFKRIFFCPSCKWKMPVEEVHRRGGLDRIAYDVAHGNPDGIKESNWEEIDRLPEWAYNKMKKRRTNKVNGEHYIYKRDGNKFYRKKK